MIFDILILLAAAGLLALSVYSSYALGMRHAQRDREKRVREDGWAGILSYDPSSGGDKR